jgi:hypothetical protein
MQCIFNNNGNSALAAAGNYCALIPPAMNIGPLVAGSANTLFGNDLNNARANGLDVVMLENVSYLLNPNALGSGTVTFQSLEMDGTGPAGVASWVNLATPAPITLTASTPANGSFAGPFLGIRLNLSGTIAGATYARLSASVRTGSL